MLRLALTALEELRDKLQRRGQRPSMILPSANPNIVEAIQIVEEFGHICEAMYLVMAADRRVFNVEREVLRGALDVLSNGRVRTAHMEAMLDASARRAASEGEEKRLRKVIEALRDDPVRAETTVLLAAAVAAADGKIVPEEQAIFSALARGLEVDEDRANQLLGQLTSQLEKPDKKPDKG
jgi:tellurite resistance protein